VPHNAEVSARWHVAPRPRPADLPRTHGRRFSTQSSRVRMRAGRAQAARASRHCDSIIGHCPLHSDGHTISTAFGRMAIVDQESVSD